MIDVWLDETGDLEVGYDGDLRLSSGPDCGLQSIAFVVKTEPGELWLHPEVGTGLAALIGKAMTRETITLGEKLLLESIRTLPSVSDSTISVKGAPVSATEAVFVVSMIYPDGKKLVACAIPFDFHYGVNLDGIRAVGSDSVQQGVL